jgi:hypothetical protein
MDTTRILREFVGSVRLLWSGEAKLFAGALVVAVGYAVWLGATGAALAFGFDLGGQPTAVATWEGMSLLAVGLAALAWVVVPAAVVTVLVDRAVTNANGTVHQQYRVRHPFLLVAPFLLLFVVGVGVAVAVGERTGAVLAGLSAVGLFALVRTVPASYRVFSFSHPRLVEGLLFVALVVDAVALPVSVATLTGRQAIVDAASAGLGQRFATSAVETVLTGSTTVAGVSVPYLLGATAGVPVALTLSYFLVQGVVAGVTRLRSPDTPRGNLRTGQRYPDFARPVRGASGAESTPTSSATRSSTASRHSAGPSSTESAGTADGGSGSTPTPSASAGDTATETDSSDVTGDEADSDDVSHTKVFKPPSDGDFDAGNETGSEETAVVSGNGYVCPSCEDRFGPEASFEYCPTCGSELEDV